VLFKQVDQSLDYFYFILDIPLDELKDKGYYYNCLEYYPPITSWVIKYCKQWAEWLNTPESWNNQYYQHAYDDKAFGLQQGWYEDKSNWHSFNDFFARKLSSANARPIANLNDDSVVTAPADSEPQGIWKIDNNSEIMSSSDQIVSADGSTVMIKSKGFKSVTDILHGSNYANDFAGGTLTHTFLNVNDYHRYHFPMSGKVLEAKIIPADDAAGGIVIWDSNQKKYVLNSENPNWESIETRGYVILETKQYGKVALLPVGMSQVSSVNFDKNVKAGVEVKKGDELGYFLFGGSDFVMIFQKDINVKLAMNSDKKGVYPHMLMGEKYAFLSKK
jgi:phosphatidylserine decarboxylase precursor